MFTTVGQQMLQILNLPGLKPMRPGLVETID
jgi:hypothetical protein